MNALRLILGIVALSGATVLKAGTLTYDADIDGINAPAGVTFSAAGSDTLNLGTMVSSHSVSKFLGLNGDSPGNGLELRLNQSLILTFATPQIFDYLTIGLLFDGVEHEDSMERAGAYANGSVDPFILKAIGELTAEWSFSGATVLNLSPANESANGVWRVTNPFGNLAITSLRLSPLTANNPDGSESDFGLVAFSTRSVPDLASTASILALALALLISVKRRQS